MRRQHSLKCFFFEVVMTALIKFDCLWLYIIFFKKLVMVYLQEIRVLLLNAYANFLPSNY